MKTSWLLLLTLFGGLTASAAAPPPPPPPILGKISTTWTGVEYQIAFVKRIALGRLLVGVRLVTTDKSAPKGTLIGFTVPIPAGANKYDVAAGYYRPLPLSIASSVMIDEATQQRYPALPQAGPLSYRPPLMLKFMHPKESFIMTLQFTEPPPLPPTPENPTPRHTVSFVIPKATGPITHVVLPPPPPPTITAPQ